MPNLRESTVRIALVLMVLTAIGAGAGAQAAGWSKSPIEPGRYTVRDPVHPLAPQSITQNIDPNTIEAGASVACVGAQTTDNGWWRLYDLDADHGLQGEFCTQSVDYGIETAVGPTQNLAANVFCLDDGLPFLNAFLVLAGTASQPQPDAELEFFNIEVAGCCDSETQSMAVELLSDDCQETMTCQLLFIGMNGLGETAPTYITAPDCAVDDPTSLELVCFGIDGCDLVQIVNGDGASDGGGGVPATSGPGAMLMVLAVLGTSALFLRRRETTVP